MRLSWPVCCLKWLPEGIYSRSPVQLVTGTLRGCCSLLLSLLFNQKLPTSPSEEAEGEARGPSAGEVQRLACSPETWWMHRAALGRQQFLCALHCIKDSSVLQHWRWSPLPYNILTPWPATHWWIPPAEDLGLVGCLDLGWQFLLFLKPPGIFAYVLVSLFLYIKLSPPQNIKRTVLPPNWQSEEIGEDGHACCFIQVLGKHLLWQKSLWCLPLSPFRQWKARPVHILSQLLWVNSSRKRSTASPTGAKAGPSCRHVSWKGQAFSGLLWASPTFPLSCPCALFWAVPSWAFLTLNLMITVPIRGIDFSWGNQLPTTTPQSPLPLLSLPGWTALSDAAVSQIIPPDFCAAEALTAPLGTRWRTALLRLWVVTRPTRQERGQQRTVWTPIRYQRDHSSVEAFSCDGATTATFAEPSPRRSCPSRTLLDLLKWQT